MNPEDLETLKNEAKWMSSNTRDYKNILVALEVVYKMGQSAGMDQATKLLNES